MNEPIKYPEAWGVLDVSNAFWWTIHGSKNVAEGIAENHGDAEVVRLIPEQEVDQKMGELMEAIRTQLAGFQKCLSVGQKIQIMQACGSYNGPCFCDEHLSEVES